MRGLTTCAVSDNLFLSHPILDIVGFSLVCIDFISRVKYKFDFMI